jgi:hypothetical protein
MYLIADNTDMYVCLFVCVCVTPNVIGNAAATVTLLIYKFHPFHDSLYKQTMQTVLHVYLHLSE